MRVYIRSKKIGLCRLVCLSCGSCNFHEYALEKIDNAHYLQYECSCGHIDHYRLKKSELPALGVI